MNMNGMISDHEWHLLILKAKGTLACLTLNSSKQTNLHHGFRYSARLVHTNFP